MVRKILFLIVLMIYGGLFWQEEYAAGRSAPRLAYPVSAGTEKALLGYLRQLGGVLHFIRASVYAGSLASRKQHVFDTGAFAASLDSAAELNPLFVDTYYYCESFVATQGGTYARLANTILEKGITALPENWVLPFFKGFNHFHYLDEPVEAANALQLAYRKPDAPPWLGHLASVLSARGGEIRAGLILLKAMHAGEEDATVKQGYEDDITAFEKALEVQKAVSVFHNQYGRVPSTLNELVPELLPALPDFKSNYILIWEPPVVRMDRPHAGKMPLR